ncbi:MAG: bifunctional 4-hydroxy-2-oxoglutarate aldolase/2-dehydro-3-deoxy-phosphogluconate aldolase [Polyangiaceae bacterium]|nr:bifunctional 4-hydroxy-2-oxoglutarate aldolase/2-dehydro-3-deoxy-phosphogluconate aldolase [Polyangiaceae bacterium]
MPHRSDTLHELEATALVAIVRAASSERALRATRLIHASGIRLIEVTMTVPNALGVLEELAKALGDDVTLGAGTVLDPETVRACVGAGARFIVSPNFDPATVEMAQSLGAVSMPGALTPTEVVAAMRAGADCVKVFPCSAVGGPSYVRALRGPLPDVKLVATGGVELENAVEYLKAGATAVGLGGGLIDWGRVEREGEQSVVEHIRRFVGAIAGGR